MLVSRYCIQLAVLVLSNARIQKHGNIYRPRVIGGVPDVKSQYGFVVAIATVDSTGNIVNSRYCTGSLLSDSWVLTVAHCCSQKIDYKIIYGNMENYPEITTSTVLKLFPFHGHKNFTRTASFRYDIHLEVNMNDIGLMLVNKVKTKSFAKIWAFDYKTLYGIHVYYAGFGRTFLDKNLDDLSLNRSIADDLKKPLQIGDGIVIPCNLETSCNSPSICIASSYANRVQKIEIGDSGGPLIYKGKIIGLACGVTTYHIQFTPIVLFIEWMNNVMFLTANITEKALRHKTKRDQKRKNLRWSVNFN